MKYELLKHFASGTFVLLATESNGLQHVVTNSIHGLAEDLAAMPKEEAVNFSEELSQYQIIEVKL